MVTRFWTTILVKCLLLVAIVQTASVHKSKSFRSGKVRAADDQGWPAFGGGDDHSGYRNETLGNFTRLSFKWNATSTVSAGTSFLSPVIYNGFIISILDWLNILQVIDEATGKIVNTCQLDPTFQLSAPSIAADGSVLLQISTDPWWTFIAAFNPHSCQFMWTSIRQMSMCDNPYGVASSKAIGITYAPSGSTCNEMFAIKYLNGTYIYNTTLYDTRSAPGSWAPTVTQDNRILFSAGLGSGNQAMVGEIYATSGQVLWTEPLQGSSNLGAKVSWVPVVSNGLVLVAVTQAVSSVALAAVQMNDPKHPVIWQTDKCDWRYNSDATPSTDGTYAYMTCMDGVHAFYLKSGQSYMTYGPCKACSGQPIVTSDYLFVKSDQGVLAFDKKTGKLVAQTGEASDFIAYHNKTIFTSRMFSASLKAYAIE